MNDRPREILASGRPRRMAKWVTPLLALLIGVPAAVGVNAPPPPSQDAIAPGAAPAGTAPRPTLTPVVFTRPLRLGARGKDVKQLQLILRKRGHKVPASGTYGVRTRAIVKLIQGKLRLPKTGIATKVFFLKLGHRYEPKVTRKIPVDNYPLAGPNAAKAKYLKAFPVAGTHTYTNDWHAPRPQGVHEGTDIMAARNVPVRAVADGTISQLSRIETSRGGITIWLRDTAGNKFFYAHLEYIVGGLAAGSKVTTGQVLGGVGNTGDARGTVTHLHFEIHPGGGEPINPYTDLLAVDPEPPKQ